MEYTNDKKLKIAFWELVTKTVFRNWVLWFNYFVLLFLFVQMSGSWKECLIFKFYSYNNIPRLISTLSNNL